MYPYKEYLITSKDIFPVDVFIQDNLKSYIDVKSHYHDSIEILYMLKGTCQQQINGHSLILQKNDIIIINSGDIHATICERNVEVRILVFKFLPELIQTNLKNFNETKYLLSFLNLPKNKNAFITEEAVEHERISHIIIEIYKEFLDQKKGYEICIKGYIYQLITYLIRSDLFSVYIDESAEKNLAVLQPLLQYIESHYKDNITLEQAAKITNMSYYHLSRYFKKVIGSNFKEYLDYVRVIEFEKLMISQEITISRAALETGFSNISSFNRVYKRVRGYPPKSIKQKVQRNKQKINIPSQS
ncbi:AraC family transcriptional regulator [Vallitalea okinawensis]|uniref:AraC family transcriptional regulator n=1 Tax=Vallitalea okinawensis TaxID=2078660 RepID=UPI000CFD6F70|nr:AraC family transcriptional regulator [Vallitalea okinawensis]